MFWHAMPPELNTARLMAGAGPAPMLQAAAGWEALGGALEAQAAELAARLAALEAAWTGSGSARAIAAATPMVAWLQTAAQQARRRGMQASAQAASYVKALGITPSLPEIATNHITHAVLTATNFFGINLVPIGFNEVDYFVRMWNQAGGAMDIYQAETAANTVFEPLEPMKPILQPGAVSETVLGNLSQFSQMASEAASEVATPTAAVAGIPTGQELTQFASGIGQLGQLSGPMQQLLQPLQQLTSLAGQAGGMPGAGGAHGMAGTPGKADIGQVGLIGAPPLSNHPLAGGSGPSMGLGLMHAEALPGAGGTSPRTEMMSRLVDQSGPAASSAAAGAGAGSSAAGGAAPLGMMGQGGRSAAGARPASATPALLAEHPGEDQDFDLHDQDDGW
ncbi:PPE family protein [Mycobacterium sp.]|uniref:PPE family protein n=1 Tax=Mycobacterium sp. TaxID=1785 RepID=UPI0025FA41A2|nr:PPE family protein [Mycobacterium sp.]MBW0014177.1 PPE family protein [Mycobacterium sp.]